MHGIDRITSNPKKPLQEHYRNLCVVRKNMGDDNKNVLIAGELAGLLPHKTRRK